MIRLVPVSLFLFCLLSGCGYNGVVIEDSREMGPLQPEIISMDEDTLSERPANRRQGTESAVEWVGDSLSQPGNTQVVPTAKGEEREKKARI